MRLGWGVNNILFFGHRFGNLGVLRGPPLHCFFRLIPVPETWTPSGIYCFVRDKGRSKNRTQSSLFDGGWLQVRCIKALQYWSVNIRRGIISTWLYKCRNAEQFFISSCSPFNKCFYHFFQMSTTTRNILSMVQTFAALEKSRFLYLRYDVTWRTQRFAIARFAP